MRPKSPQGTTERIHLKNAPITAIIHLPMTAEYKGTSKDKTVVIAKFQLEFISNLRNNSK